MTSKEPNKSIESVEKEYEARLQMIAHHLDRRKMRGVVQRLTRLLVQQSKEEERERIINVVRKANPREPMFTPAYMENGKMHTTKRMWRAGVKNLRNDILYSLSSTPTKT